MSNLTHEESIRRVWRVCYILAFVTIFEIAAALLHYYTMPESPKWWLNILFVVLSAAKAYYIMSEFMHLKYELKAMTLTILTPFLFLVWGIIAFLWEGGYWLSLRQLWQ
jgi:cytochrome c oxidase subunit 4